MFPQPRMCVCGHSEDDHGGFKSAPGNEECNICPDFHEFEAVSEKEEDE